MRIAGMHCTMPFGKYKGHPLDELDDSYLSWLYSLDDLRPPPRDRVQEEFFRRRRNDASRFIPGNSRPPERARELVDAEFKTLAKIHHPDVGGSDAAMRESLEARAWLIQHVTAAQEKAMRS
jgi:hypothetical protein